MRRATILSLSLPCFALSLTLAAAAGAETAWDDSHMRSNYARQRGPAPPRPAVQGADRFHQALEDPTPTPPTGVAETTLRISPHEWKPGGPSGASTSSTSRPASATSSFESARPTVSSGVRGASVSSSSGLRSTSSSRGR